MFSRATQNILYKFVNCSIFIGIAFGPNFFFNRINRIRQAGKYLSV